MRFWDSSAILPLCLKEKTSEIEKVALKDDEDIVVWWTSGSSASLPSQGDGERECVLSSVDEAKAEVVLSALAATWSEVQPTETVRLRAERLLSIHPLGAADALQLAAALIWAEETPRGFDFVCLDQNLREGARKEGFFVLPSIKT
jgi:uncharacterized protein